MGSALVAEHVLACGYRRIGMISGPQTIFAAKLRRNEFLAHLDAGAEVVWEVFQAFHSDLTPEAQAAIRRNDVDVLVCCDDLMAAGAIHTAMDHGLSVPRDVAVIGHDDIAALTRPRITTVRQPLDAIGSEAVRMLLERIDKPGRANRSITIDVELIVRESSFAGDQSR
jgi:LacI family transcriptional regulator